MFIVRLRYAATLSFDHLHAVYEGKQQMVENFQDVIQAADVILRTGPTLTFVPVARSFFTPPRVQSLEYAVFGSSFLSLLFVPLSCSFLRFATGCDVIFLYIYLGLIDK